jgi:dGTPase
MAGIFGEIEKNNRLREERTFSRWACFSAAGSRLLPERAEAGEEGDIRPAFFHDADRIIHSRAFARYIDKTQVFTFFENDHITHRVLHVQIVSKIARGIGRSLGLNEDLIEAIALGHDLGHVPYGHEGEAVLDALSRENGIGCFCHNAQSARFLMELEQGGRGLNLTLQTLDGILAHNGEVLDRTYAPAYGKTAGAFLSEYNRCFTEPGASLGIRPMTMEGCVVRISDILAYVGRDFEDAILLHVTKRDRLPAPVRERLGDNNRDIVNTLVRDVVANSYGRDRIEFGGDIFKALRDLMDFNYENIYRNPLLKTQTAKIGNMFRQLFVAYVKDLAGAEGQTDFTKEFLTSMGPEYLDRTDPRRKAIDYISGMTDDYFNNQFKKLFLPVHYGYSL